MNDFKEDLKGIFWDNKKDLSKKERNYGFIKQEKG